MKHEVVSTGGKDASALRSLAARILETESLFPAPIFPRLFIFPEYLLRSTRLKEDTGWTIERTETRVFPPLHLPAVAFRETPAHHCGHSDLKKKQPQKLDCLQKIAYLILHA